MLIGGIVLGFLLGLVLRGRPGNLLDARLRWPAGLFFAVTATALAVVFAVASAETGMYAPLLYVLATLYGAAAMPIYGIAVAHANDKLAHDQFVPASSTLLLCYGSGAIFGPIGASYVMVALGPAGLYVFVAAVGAAAGAFVIWRTTRKAPVLPEEKGAFGPVPATTPTALTLAPAAEPPKNGRGQPVDGGSA